MRTDTVTKKLQGGHSWRQEVKTDFIIAEFWLLCSWSCVKRIRINVTKIKKMLLLLNISEAVWLTPSAFSKDRAHIVSKEALSSAVFAIDEWSRVQSGFQKLDCQQTGRVKMWFWGPKDLTLQRDTLWSKSQDGFLQLLWPSRGS